MELALIIYLIEFLNVKEFFVACLIVVTVVFCVLYGMSYADAYGDDDRKRVNETALKVCSICRWPFCAMLAFCLVAPSSDTAYKMLAAYAGMEVIQMEETKEVGGKAYEALNKVLDDYLQEGEE